MTDSNYDNEEGFHVFEDEDMFDKIRQYTDAIRFTDKSLLKVVEGIRSRFESLDAMRKTPYDEELKKMILYSHGKKDLDIIEAYEKNQDHDEITLREERK